VRAHPNVFRWHPSSTAMTRFTTDIQMRFRDIDGMGHVNNAVISPTSSSRGRSSTCTTRTAVARRDRLHPGARGHRLRIPGDVGRSDSGGGLALEDWQFLVHAQLRNQGETERPHPRAREERPGLVRLREEESKPIRTISAPSYNRASRRRQGPLGLRKPPPKAL